MVLQNGQRLTSSSASNWRWKLSDKEGFRVGDIGTDRIEERAIKIEDFLELQWVTLPKCPLSPVSAIFWLMFLLSGFSIDEIPTL